MKKAIFNTNFALDPEDILQPFSNKRKFLHTKIVEEVIARRPVNELLGTQPPEIHRDEEELPRRLRRLLAQIRAGKSPLLRDYLQKIDPENHPYNHCPICLIEPHDSSHLFRCPDMPTRLSPIDLWENPRDAAAFLVTWEQRLEHQSTVQREPPEE